jgi:uncharacterized protein YeaO (DUF488 family)
MLRRRSPLIVVDIVLTKRMSFGGSHREWSVPNAAPTPSAKVRAVHDCGGPLVPRADDREQVVLNRLQVYREQTEPLVQYYGTRPTTAASTVRASDDVTADIIRRWRSTDDSCRAHRDAEGARRRRPRRHGPAAAARREERGYASRNLFDVWVPEVSPTRELVAYAQATPWTDARWAAYRKRYLREMRRPAAQRVIALLARARQAGRTSRLAATARIRAVPPVAARRVASPTGSEGRYPAFRIPAAIR